MNEQSPSKGQASVKPQKRYSLKAVISLALVFSMVSAAGAVGANQAFRVRGGGHGRAQVVCRGGISNLSHTLDEFASIFPGDPVTDINVINTVAVDFYLLEQISVGVHTGTHFDAPAHFVDGKATVDELPASTFIMPAYVIDVRDRIATAGGDFQLSVQEIRQYERQNGRIKRGSLVILQTGWEDKFGFEGEPMVDDGEGGQVQSDDYVDDIAPGFSAETVQWLVDRRRIDGLGSDTLGPDATTDEDFGATFTILDNGGIAIPGMNNLDSMNRKGDIVIASPVRLADGSGYQVNPLGCHAR